jgi:ABC-type Fe3+-hydroxamate transport system substrate-binding protein
VRPPRKRRLQLRQGEEETLTPVDLTPPALPHAPRRVVSLVPSVTGSLFDLGLGARLVGRTDFCVYPEVGVAALPALGGTKNPAIDRVLALNPDLVIANWEENHRADVEALRAAGVPVWVTFPRTVREALTLLWEITRVFDAPQAGHMLAALERSFEIASQAAEDAPRVRVFCPIWREPAEGAVSWWMAGNHATYLHDVLAVCGGTNVLADRERRYPLAADLDPAAPAEPPAPDRDTRYPRVTSAEVAALAPEVILLPSEPYPFGEADLSAFEAWPDVPAVATGRVHLVEGAMLTWPGTHLARALAELPAILQNAPA